MNKIIIVLISIILFLSGCGKVTPPEELKSFVRNNIDEKFWYVSWYKEPIKIVIAEKHDSMRELLFKFSGKEMPSNYAEFKKNIHYITVTNYNTAEQIIWYKYDSLDNPFKQTSAIAYQLDEKMYRKGFNSTENNLSISLKRISKFEPFKKISLRNWTGYIGEFNLQRGEGLFPIQEPKGNVILHIHNSRAKIREGYLTSRGLEYYRYVDYGELPYEVWEDNDTYELIEIAWKLWNKKLKLYLKEIKDLNTRRK